MKRGCGFTLIFIGAVIMGYGLAGLVRDLIH